MTGHIDGLKATCSGRWAEIITSLCNVSPDIFDGKHHPCPKCSGKDRFRAFTDGKGGAICNQCFKTGCGDGFAVIGWLTGRTSKKDFPKIAREVANFVGYELPKPKKDPAEHLEFSGWNDDLVRFWCSMNQPIMPDSVKAFGGQIAMYRGQHRVLAFPIRGSDLSRTVGWIVSAFGKGVPTWIGKGKQPDWLKIKATSGSSKGIICPEVAEFDTAYKAEGLKDALALFQIVPTHTLVFTNAFGTSERPQKWMTELAKGKAAIVIHDCDSPGQEGATYVGGSNGRKRPGWCPEFAAAGAASVRNVVLPYPVTPNNGKDVRDWLNDGNGWTELERLIDQTELFELDEEAQSSTQPDEFADDPHRLARRNLERYRVFGRELRYWNESWYVWKDGQYVEITQDHLLARLSSSIKVEFDRHWEDDYERYEAWVKSDAYDESKDKGPPKVRRVTSQLIKNVIDATKGECKLSMSQKLESWIDNEVDGWCVSVQNGILNLSRLLDSDAIDDAKILMPHSPLWFSTIKLPYAFDPRADCPVWKEFLRDVFNDDEEAIDALQKWVGYLLTPDTSLQKIMFIIGQSRSGKGTILRVVRGILGVNNVAAPTLTSLAGQFGLEPLVGKTVALIPDARISSRADEVAITERLLSISGNDPQDVHRKFKPTLCGQELPVRFTLFSNLLPRLKDASSAFINRCIFLSMPNTYIGREDTTLADRLSAELSGILNWAIVGRLKLNRTTTISQPRSGEPLLDEMKSIMSPVLQFVEQNCTFGTDLKCQTRELFAAWEQWCHENELTFSGTIQTFSRRLKAIKPMVDTKQQREPWGRARYFIGVDIKRDD